MRASTSDSASITESRDREIWRFSYLDLNSCIMYEKNCIEGCFHIFDSAAVERKNR
jgi:hypothetical protein